MSQLQSTEPTADAEKPLDEGTIHDLLRNDRRRLTIKTLQETPDGRASVSALAEQIAALETGEDPPPRSTRQSVYVSLYQTHLPKLDEFGVVAYDATDKQVTLTERVAEVAVYMEVVPRYGLSWGEFYFGLGLLGLLTTLAVLLGVPGIAPLGLTLVTSGFFVALMLAATYQVYTQQDTVFIPR